MKTSLWFDSLCLMLILLLFNECHEEHEFKTTEINKCDFIVNKTVFFNKKYIHSPDCNNNDGCHFDIKY